MNKVINAKIMSIRKINYSN